MLVLLGSLSGLNCFALLGFVVLEFVLLGLRLHVMVLFDYGISSVLHAMVLCDHSGVGPVELEFGLTFTTKDKII